MRVRFWGTRGSVPTPGPATVRYGGNTSCVELLTEQGTRFILDSGTGIRELGLSLGRTEASVRAHILLGHTHWDHISGFPFFAPAFQPGNAFVVYGARDLDRPLRDVLAGQMHFTYFPVPLGDLRADLEFRELDEEEFEVDGATVRTHYLNHTAVCMGYRIESDGATVAYITDHEPFGRATHVREARPDETDGSVQFAHGGDQRLVAFVRGADLLIMDAQYTPEEYAEHQGWGHAGAHYVTDVAMAAGVRRVALFHHEPTHQDERIDEMVTFCQQRARDAGANLEVLAAAEGATIVV